MKIIKNVKKSEMFKSMQVEAKKANAICGNDCPRCRVQDG